MNWTLVSITLINAVASVLAAVFSQRATKHAELAVKKIESLRPPPLGPDAGDRFN